MMKIFLSVVSLFFVSYSIAQTVTQKPKFGWWENKLKSKVKSIQSKDYVAVEKFGEAQKEKLDICRKDKFNEKGNIVQLTYLKENGSIEEKVTFKYSDKENKIEENDYDSIGNLLRKEIYIYYTNENKIQEWEYDSNGNLNGRFTYKYDDKGNVFEFYSYKDNGALNWKNTYRYDDKGYKIEENLDSDKYTFMNDDKGNEIETKLFKSDGRITKYTFKYSYDKKSNWIKKITYKDDKLYLITEREIEYF